MDKSKAVLDALESEDPVIIKTIRGSQLGNLTRSLNALKTALVVNADGAGYDLDKISESKVKHIIQ